MREPSSHQPTNFSAYHLTAHGEIPLRKAMNSAAASGVGGFAKMYSATLARSCQPASQGGHSSVISARSNTTVLQSSSRACPPFS